MPKAQQMVEMEKALNAVHPVYAKAYRMERLQNICDLCKSSYENLLRLDPENAGLPLMKAKLGAYLMCKGTDKVKARKAIDAFVALAHEDMQNVVNGGVTVACLGQNFTVTYGGAKDDKNARVLGDSLKNTIEGMEFFYERM